MRKKVYIMAGIALFSLATASYAFGPHTGLDCLGCHDPHYAKGEKIFKVKNEKLINPRTDKPIDHISALCLGCHNIQSFDGAGVRPIHLHMTHPVNIVPNEKIAQVPEVLIRNEVIQCISCHDPHPSNPYWKYLRVDTEAGAKVGQFCQMCHPAKADSEFYGTAKTELNIFSSMDESKGAGAFPLAENPTISNPTPVYIQPFGHYPNSLAPAWTTVPNEDWIFDPSPENVPDYLKQYLTGGGETPAPEGGENTAPTGQ